MPDSDSPIPQSNPPSGDGSDRPAEPVLQKGARFSDAGVLDKGGRMPPQALEVEQSILGAMMIEREAIPKVIEILSDDAFYDSRHQKIFQAIQNLFGSNNPVDLVTLTEELKKQGHYEEISGYYLTELTTSVASAANVEYHAHIIAEKSLLRKLITTMSGVVGEAYDPTTDAFNLLDGAEREIFQISESHLRKRAVDLKSVVKRAIKHIEDIHGGDHTLTGVPSGFSRLDQLTGGWQKSDLIVIAARPSMGKTALSLAIARNAALHPDLPTGVAYFSLEMSADQLAQRLLTSEARVDSQQARTGRLRDDDFPPLVQAASRLAEAPIFIDDTPGLGILELRAKARRLRAEHDIGIVVVDYLQLMQGTQRRASGTREQEISEISRSLKGLAKELNVPVIALSQLSRAVENRGGDKRPLLSDLRESGAIEQDSDVVAFIYRAERYGITVDDHGRSTQGRAEIIIGKQRNGPIDTVELAFVDRYARFENLTSYPVPQAPTPDSGAGGEAAPF